MGRTRHFIFLLFFANFSFVSKIDKGKDDFGSFCFFTKNQSFGTTKIWGLSIFNDNFLSQ